ncbi:hypothetical protein, partial [uncultured Nostoc sp.]|uniref:hypothetical protein n=1 Tax=uncultured Nostoc sp. TaxID=340711 RepID=UPI0035CB56DB
MPQAYHLIIYSRSIMPLCMVEVSFLSFGHGKKPNFSLPRLIIEFTQEESPFLKKLFCGYNTFSSHILGVTNFKNNDNQINRVG